MCNMYNGPIVNGMMPPISYGGGGCPGNLIMFLNGKIIPFDKAIPFGEHSIDESPGYYVEITNKTWMNFPTSDFFARRVHFQIQEELCCPPITRKMINVVAYNVYEKNDILTLRLAVVVNDNKGNNRLTDEEVEYLRDIDKKAL